jgi:hypothetical protein
VVVDYHNFEIDEYLLEDLENTYSYQSSAAIFINNGSDNYYVIDYEFIGFVIEYPNEPYSWNLELTTRLILFIPSLLLIGLFVLWGQKRNYN